MNELCERLLAYLNSINYLSKHQHGFTKGKNTLTNLLETYNYVTKNLDLDRSVDVIYIDFEKAFDKIDIGLLIKKLFCIKCPTYIVNWLQSFLLRRSQRVSVRGVLSKSLPVLSGVPQGCVISPLLFIVYINDVFSLSITSELNFFADDNILYNLSENSSTLQSDLITLHEWCKHNCLKINIIKTCILRFGKPKNNVDYKIDGISLKQLNEVKDLGVFIDKTLGFGTQCLSVVKRASYLSYSVLKIFKFATMESKYFIFKIFIKPLLDYNLIFYFPRTKTLISLLEKVQRRFTKRICPVGLSYEQRLKLLSGFTIEKHYKITALLIMYKILYCDFQIDGFCYKLFSSKTRGADSKISLPFLSQIFVNHSLFYVTLISGIHLNLRTRIFVLYQLSNIFLLKMFIEALA